MKNDFTNQNNHIKDEKLLISMWTQEQKCCSLFLYIYIMLNDKFARDSNQPDSTRLERNEYAKI